MKGNFSNRDINTLIIVIVISIVFLGVLFGISKLTSNKNQSNVVNDELSIVSEYNTFFSVVNYVNEYLSYVSKSDNDKIYSLLYSDYIVNNNISVNNIYDFVDTYSSDVNLRVNYIYYKNIGSNILYYVKGLIVSDTDVIINDNYEIIVLYDYDTAAYAIYPVSKDYMKIINGIQDINISKNKYNLLEEVSLVTTEQICSIYLSDFVSDLFNNSLNAYNSLDSSFRNSKFPSKDVFDNFITSNSNLFSSVVDKCSVSKFDSGKYYSIYDINGNFYSFVESSIFNYSVTFNLNN